MLVFLVQWLLFLAVRLLEVLKMGKLAVFIESLFGRVFSFLSLKLGAEIATKMTVIFTLATLYVGGVASFNAFVTPLLSGLFATDFGMVLGLAFPPVAGVVISGLITLWAGTIVYGYIHAFGLAIIQR